MKRILSNLSDASPKELVNQIKAKPGSFIEDSEADRISDQLRTLFSIYQTSNLKSISADEFKQAILSKIGSIDADIEGYSESELDRQRDLSIKYYWGHNHDFGDFKLEGRMGNRHINLLSNFVTYFPISLDDFRQKQIFDIGCWTGGTTLLLAALARNVYAIEEVKKYAETVSFLVKSFNIDNRVSVEPRSLYDCNSEQFYQRFDIAYFPGVIYHLSDPLLALRILFNSLKVGGVILVESAGINVDEPFCRFDGSRIYNRGAKEKLNCGGWKWFIPSPTALYQMMKEAGFDEIQTKWHGARRVYGYGRKVSQIGICKAGLSVPNIM